MTMLDPGGGPPRGSPPVTHQLDRDEERALARLFDAVTALHVSPRTLEPGVSPVALTTDLEGEGRRLADCALSLASALARSTMGDERAHAELGPLARDADAIARSVGGRARPIVREIGKRPELRQGIVLAASTILEQIGLGTLDAHVILGVEDARRHSITWQPIGPVMAWINLADQIFLTAEELVRADPLLTLERRASRWWFECWSAGPTDAAKVDHEDEEAASRLTRECEYSLVERRTIATGRSVMKEMSLRAGFADLGERQRAIARGLIDSVIGVFAIHPAEAGVARFERLGDGAMFPVRLGPLAFGFLPGRTPAGRIIPIGDGTFVPSLGMHIIDGDLRPQLEPLLARADTEGPVDWPIILELMASRRSIEDLAPRASLPAESPEEAIVLCRAIEAALDAAGRRRGATPRAVTEADDEALRIKRELIERLAEEPGIVAVEMPDLFELGADPADYDIDAVLDAWWGCVREQAFAEVVADAARRGQAALRQRKSPPPPPGSGWRKPRR